MSNFKTYCRIIDYLDATDSDLAQLVRGTCVDLTLGSTRGKNGLTFLVPDKEYRAKIAKYAYSADPAEATKACDMLNALILRDVFKSGTDFMAKRANIPNSLFPSQHVGIKDVKGNTVNFESGASAVLDSKFADSSKKNNLAVWHLKGEIPVTSDRPAKIERKPAGRGAKGAKDKRGGYDDSDAEKLSQNLRWQIAVVVENEYVLSRLQKDTVGSSVEDPFVKHAMSLVEYLHNSEHSDILKEALPLLSISKADFYFLVEPHRSGGNFLIPSAIIDEWWKLRAEHRTDQGCKIINELLKEEKNSEKLDEINTIRKQLLKECQTRNCVDDVKKAYETKYNDAGILKMVQDELRFIIHCEFAQLESRKYDSGKFAEIVNIIGEYMHKMSGSQEEKLRGNVILNNSAVKLSIVPSDKIAVVNCFINSTYFMFIPLSYEEANGIKKSHSDVPTPETKGLWNIHLKNQDKHKRVYVDKPDQSLEDVLNSVGGEIADRIRAAIARK